MRAAKLVLMASALPIEVTNPPASSGAVCPSSSSGIDSRGTKGRFDRAAPNELHMHLLGMATIPVLGSAAQLHSSDLHHAIGRGKLCRPTRCHADSAEHGARQFCKVGLPRPRRSQGGQPRNIFPLLRAAYLRPAGSPPRSVNRNPRRPASHGGGAATHLELLEGRVGSGWRRGEWSIFGNGVRIPDWMLDNVGEFPNRKHGRCDERKRNYASHRPVKEFAGAVAPKSNPQNRHFSASDLTHSAHCGHF